MSSVDVNAKLLSILKESSCFGLVYDSTVPECKKCDVAAQCKAASSGALIERPVLNKKKEKPATETVTTTNKLSSSTKPAASTANKAKTPANTSSSKKTTKPASKPAEAVNSDMPDFKNMTWEELVALAATRSVEWKEYGSAQINRMRLIMGLKKSYT
ncbi:hypothetical protein D3C73_817490 [compost metagenome]